MMMMTLRTTPRTTQHHCIQGDNNGNADVNDNDDDNADDDNADDGDNVDDNADDDDDALFNPTHNSTSLYTR